MSESKLNKPFADWLDAYDEERANSECVQSYYDSDTGHNDTEQARYDEMQAAFEAGGKFAARTNDEAYSELTAELEQKEARINRLLFLIARKDSIIDDYQKLVRRIHSEK